MNPADFGFGSPSSLNWAWAVAALALLVAVRARARGRALATFADARLLASIAPTAGTGRPLLRSVLALAGLALLVPALMDPRWGAQVEEVKRRRTPRPTD